MGAWDSSIVRDIEGMGVKQELMAMWQLKLQRVRAKLGVDENVIATHEDATLKAPLPPPRSEIPHATPEVTSPHP